MEVLYDEIIPGTSKKATGGNYQKRVTKSIFCHKTQDNYDAEDADAEISNLSILDCDEGKRVPTMFDTSFKPSSLCMQR